jgi:hypothetical protein
LRPPRQDRRGALALEKKIAVAHEALASRVEHAGGELAGWIPPRMLELAEATAKDMRDTQAELKNIAANGGSPDGPQPADIMDGIEKQLQGWQKTSVRLFGAIREAEARCNPAKRPEQACVSVPSSPTVHHPWAAASQPTGRWVSRAWPLRRRL